jgi:predicted amidohydrolase
VRIRVENIGVGTAFVSDPRGQIVAKLQSNVPSMLVCEIDLSQVSDKAHIRDRRPELYDDLGRPR